MKTNKNVLKLSGDKVASEGCTNEITCRALTQTTHRITRKNKLLLIYTRSFGVVSKPNGIIQWQFFLHVNMRKIIWMFC